MSWPPRKYYAKVYYVDERGVAEEREFLTVDQAQAFCQGFYAAMNEMNLGSIKGPFCTVDTAPTIKKEAS